MGWSQFWVSGQVSKVKPTQIGVYPRESAAKITKRRKDMAAKKARKTTKKSTKRLKKMKGLKSVKPLRINDLMKC